MIVSDSTNTENVIQGWHLKQGDIIREKERNYTFLVHLHDGRLIGEKIKPVSRNVFDEKTFENLREDWFYQLIDRGE